MHVDGAWDALNVDTLWLPNGVVGTNRGVGHAAGRRALPWRRDQSTYSIRMVIDGHNNGASVPYDNPLEGLEFNVGYLYDQLVVPLDDPTSDVTRPASLVMPSGAVRYAEVQPTSLETQSTEGLGCYMAVMTLVVPSGMFSETS